MTEFIEAHCRITRGERTGELLQLEPFQRQLLTDLFALAADGKRRYRRAYLQLPRKNGKTTLMAAVSLYEALTGELGGEVYYVAAAKDQARRAFEEVQRMVELDETLRELTTVFRNSIEIPSTGTILRVLSAEAGLQLGLSPSFVVFDEVAMQPNERLWSAMSLGSGTRSQPMIVGISTPGWQRDGLAGRLYEHGQRVAHGEVDDPTFFFRCWEPRNPAADYTDPAVWREANPAIGSFLSEADFSAHVKGSESEFRRFRLGQWTSTREAALPAGAWEACARPDFEVAPRATVTIGIDPSFQRDATGVVGCTLPYIDEDGRQVWPHLFVVDVFESPPDDPSWRINVADVMAALEQSRTRYDVRLLGFDPPRWGELIGQLDVRGLSEPEFLVQFNTGTPAVISRAWLAFRDAVMDGHLTHDGDERLARHVRNLVLKSDRLGQRPTRDRNAPRSFIDAAIAAIVAYDLAIVATKQRSVPEPLFAWG